MMVLFRELGHRLPSWFPRPSRPSGAQSSTVSGPRGAPPLPPGCSTRAANATGDSARRRPASSARDRCRFSRTYRPWPAPFAPRRRTLPATTACLPGAICVIWTCSTRTVCRAPWRSRCKVVDMFRGLSALCGPEIAMPVCSAEVRLWSLRFLGF